MQNNLASELTERIDQIFEPYNEALVVQMSDIVYGVGPSVAVLFIELVKEHPELTLSDVRDHLHKQFQKTLNEICTASIDEHMQVKDMETFVKISEIAGSNPRLLDAIGKVLNLKPGAIDAFADHQSKVNEGANSLSSAQTLVTEEKAKPFTSVKPLQSEHSLAKVETINAGPEAKFMAVQDLKVTPPRITGKRSSVHMIIYSLEHEIIDTITMTDRGAFPKDALEYLNEEQLSEGRKSAFGGIEKTFEIMNGSVVMCNHQSFIDRKNIYVQLLNAAGEQIFAFEWGGEGRRPKVMTEALTQKQIYKGRSVAHKGGVFMAKFDDGQAVKMMTRRTLKESSERTPGSY